jgi:hypothetical protein
VPQRRLPAVGVQVRQPGRRPPTRWRAEGGAGVDEGVVDVEQDGLQRSPHSALISGTAVFARTPMPSTSTSTRLPGRIGPRPAGVAGEDHVAGQQRHRRRHEGTIAGTSWIISDGPAVLHGLAVQPGSPRRSEASIRSPRYGPSGQKDRALRPPPLPVALLHVARGDVVGAGVAEDDLVGALAGARPAHRPMTTPARPRSAPRRTPAAARSGRRADHGRVRLEEDQRLVGHLVAELGGVLGVVAADAEHLAPRDHRREQAGVVERDALAGELDRRVERIPGDDGDLRALDDPEPGVLPRVNLAMSTVGSLIRR